MTVSTFIYSAVLTGTPAVTLAVKGGSVSLDDASYPHVQAHIDVAVPGSWTTSGGVTTWAPNLASWMALDPRQTKRITVSANFGSGTRTFNLGLRDRRVNQANATISLTLASDEALVGDYAPYVDDAGAFAFQSSLRGVINYVLGKSIPGASLAASPAHNADFTTYSDAENLIPDPRITGTGAIYSASGATMIFDSVQPGPIDGVPHNGRHLHTPTTTDAYLSVSDSGSLTPFGMQAGKTYVFSANGSVRSTMGGSVHARARRLVAFFKLGSVYTEIASSAVPTTVQTGGGTGTRVSVEITIPEFAEEVILRAYHGHASGSITWSQFRLTEKNENPGIDDAAYFWGGKPDTAAYDYSWSADADNSVSRRRALIDRSPDLLWWKAGVDGMDFLTPIFQAAGLRLVNDEARVWTLRNESYAATGALTVRYGVNLIDGDDFISRDSGLWFDAAVVRYEWTDQAGNRQERIDSFKLNTPYSRLQLIERLSPYPGPGFAEYVVRRAQGRGRELSLTTVADWTARAEQSVTAVLEGAPTQVGRTSRVDFNLSNDEMTITTRTVDTPLGAIDLLTGTINSLTGTINNL